MAGRGRPPKDKNQEKSSGSGSKQPATNEEKNANKNVLSESEDDTDSGKVFNIRLSKLEDRKEFDAWVYKLHQEFDTLGLREKIDALERFLRGGLRSFVG